MNEIMQYPHIRKNILTGERVLVSPHRTQRPWQGKQEEQVKQKTDSYDPKCYLCPGNTRAGGKQNPFYEDTFTFVNDFAALMPDIKSGKKVQGLLEAQAEKGICKVICFSPDHSQTLADMSLEQVEKVIETWQREFIELSRYEFINNIQIFENKGAIMGCSNPHPHGQIWAQSTIPLEIERKTMNFKSHGAKSQNTLLQDYLNQEIEINQRIIHDNEDFTVLVPFWAVWPYETMIIPKRGMKHITEMNNGERSNFALAISTITKIYDRVFDISFPYSVGIHQAPVDYGEYSSWHWHMSFYPPLLRSATVKKFMVGYEMFGMPQRDITPEIAAERLNSLK